MNQPTYTTIPENRDKKRSVADLIKELDSLSFAEEIERDKNRSKVLIERGERAKEILNSVNLSNEDRVIMRQEVASANVYKRALLLIGASGMQITGINKTEKASDNNLPTSTYLAHQGRFLLQIPPRSDSSLINWLTSGNKNFDGRSESQNHNKAMRQGKYVYNRSAATHDVHVEKGRIKEKKGFLIGVRDFVLNKTPFVWKKTNHYGVDLACDAEFGGLDSRGELVKKPDGEHGHLYIHYKPATATEPGSIMLGLEGAAPRSSNHSKVGAADPMSPTCGSRWNKLNKKKKFSNEKEYNRTIIPQRHNGFYATPTEENIEAIVKQNIDSFNTNLATAIPQASLSSFIKQKEQGHRVPIFQEPKKLVLVQEPSRWKKVINWLTFGKAYKKECATYRQYVKNQKMYNKITTGYNTRKPEPSLSSQPSLSPDTTPQQEKRKEILR